MLRLPLKPTLVCLLLLVGFVIYYTHAALTFPTLFNIDNHLNYSATEYLVEHQSIPFVEANDEQIMFTDIGTTRLLRPPFTFIVSAVAASLTEGVIDDRIKRQRLGSPLIGSITIVVIFIGFYLAFRHIGVATLGALLIGLLPKFVFLASCNNDDIGAILSVSCLLTSVIALLRYQAKTSVLVALAFSFGLVLQTKYTAWLVLPWLGMFCLVAVKSEWRKLVKLAPLLLLVCIVAGGWWLVLNMANYGIGDPAAIGHAQQLQIQLSDIEPNRQGYLSEGVGLGELLTNHEQFLSKSFGSFVGYLEWLELDVGVLSYWFYGLVFLIAIAGTLFALRFSAGSDSKAQDYLALVLILLVLSQCAFYIHHNLVRDIQPQSRYILPITMPLVYLFLRQIQRVSSGAIVVGFRGREYGFQSIASATLIALCLIIHVVTMQRYVLPVFNSQPFFTSLQEPKKYSVNDVFEVSSSESLSHRFIGNKLELQRTAGGHSSLSLAASFCDRLPLNALITMTAYSLTKGGFNLHIDRSGRGTFESVYWRSVPAGPSVAIFSISSRECSGVKLSLSRNTYQLSLENLEISELKIHQYGKPL